MNKSKNNIFRFVHILLDYDNTTGLSEAPAFRACTSLVNEVLTDYGVPLQFTPAELLAKFVGKSFRQMILDLSAEHSFTVEPGDLEKLVVEEEDRVIAALLADLQECEGVGEAINWAEDNLYTLSVVSSSALRRLRACIKKLSQEAIFEDRVYSASSSLPTPQSKPNPAIYIHALKELHTYAKYCLAVEDSGSGVKAAVAAGIMVVAYVGAYEAHEREEAAAKLMALGAKTVMHHWSEFPGIVERLEAEINAARKTA